MGRLMVLLAIVLLAVSPASAADQYQIRLTDVFPVCTVGSDASNIVRCGLEFLVPNLHISGMANLFVKEIMAIFNLLGTPFEMVGDAISVTPDYISCGIYQAEQKLKGNAGWFEPVGCPMLTKEWKSPIDRVVDALFGVITPFLVVIFLFAFEFIKTYLIVGIAYFGWTAVILKSSPTPNDGVIVSVIVIILLVVGSIFLLGTDLGIYSLLVNV